MVHSIHGHVGGFPAGEVACQPTTYGVIPPKILLQAGLVESGVVFIVKRALYGLRESPALWAAHRTETLQGLSVESPEGRIYLKQMITDGELWMILVEPKGGGNPVLRGILVTYVDDLLYMGERKLILQLHEKISSTWPCSALEFADEGLRYLGMELVQTKDQVTLSQESYVDNLVRLHGLDPGSSAGLPCPKEWLQDEDFDDNVENFNEEEFEKSSAGHKRMPVAGIPYSSRCPVRHKLYGGYDV